LKTFQPPGGNIMKAISGLWTLFALLSFALPLLAEERPIKIGVLACLSGECAEWGNNTLRGVTLATEEINTRGGVLGRQLEIVIQDTREASSGVAAVSAFRQLSSQQDISYFVGPTWTPAGLALAPIASNMKNIIVTSPSLGVADFNEHGDNLFNTWPHDENGTRALARYAFEKGWHRAAIFSSQQPWEQAQGEIFAEEMTRLGGSVVAHVEPLPDTYDLKTEALRIRRTNPDVVFFSNTNRLGVAAREIRQFGYSGPVLAALLDETRLQDGMGALNGAITARYPEASPEFQQRFQQRFGEPAGITADTAYDTVMLYAAAIEQMKTMKVAIIKDAIQRIELDGASGRISFNSRGSIQRDPSLFEARGLELANFSTSPTTVALGIPSRK